MAEADTGYKWWIRYVLVPIIGGGGVVALLVAYINRPLPPPSAPTPVQANPDSVPVTTSVSPADVEQLVAKWLAAWLSGNADDFVAAAGTPFYFDKEVILTRADLRSRYVELAGSKLDTWKKLEIKSIKIQTVAQLQATGYDLTSDRIFRSMNLSTSDFAVSVQSALNGRVEGMLVVVRRRGNAIEIAGMWD